MKQISPQRLFVPKSNPSGLWSLLAMLTKFAREFMELGEQIANARLVFQFVDSEEVGSPRKDLDAEERAQLGFAFSQMYRLCDDLDLPTSKELFLRAHEDAKLPETGREFEGSKESFPKAREEMANAGRSHAVGLHTAAVFHCMRAVEIGLRAMAIELDVKIGDIPLELADQEQVIRGIESKIQGMKDRKKTAEKDDDLNFYSQVAMQFRYFKDGWRVRTAHTRATYEEGDSLSVLEHAASFIGDLSKRLKEPVL